MRYWITGMAGVLGGLWLIVHRLLAGSSPASSASAAGPWTGVVLGAGIVIGGVWFIRKALRR